MFTSCSLFLLLILSVSLFTSISIFISSIFICVCMCKYTCRYIYDLVSNWPNFFPFNFSIPFHFLLNHFFLNLDHLPLSFPLLPKCEPVCSCPVCSCPVACSLSDGHVPTFLSCLPRLLGSLSPFLICFSLLSPPCNIAMPLWNEISSLENICGD